MVARKGKRWQGRQEETPQWVIVLGRFILGALILGALALIFRSWGRDAQVHLQTLYVHTYDLGRGPAAADLTDVDGKRVIVERDIGLITDLATKRLSWRPLSDSKRLTGATTILSALKPENLKGIENVEKKHGDVLVWYLSVHTFTTAKKAYLLGSAFPSGGKDGGENKDWLELEEFLTALKDSYDGQMLLLLDAGRLDADLRQGMAVNYFPQRLHEALKKSGGDNLWVICSHDTAEINNISITRGHTLFAEGIAYALQRMSKGKVQAANFYDRLVEFCRHETEEQPQVEQIPLLMRGGVGRVKLDVDTQAAQLLALGTWQPAEEVVNDNETEKKKDEGETKDKAKEAGKGGKKPPADTTLDPRQKLLAELDSLWAVRDKLEQRSGTKGWSPVDFAPHYWRMANYKLAQFDLQVMTTLLGLGKNGQGSSGTIKRLRAEAQYWQINLDALFQLFSKGTQPDTSKLKEEFKEIANSRREFAAGEKFWETRFDQINPQETQAKEALRHYFDLAYQIPEYVDLELALSRGWSAQNRLQAEIGRAFLLLKRLRQLTEAKQVSVVDVLKQRRLLRRTIVELRKEIEPSSGFEPPLSRVHEYELLALWRSPRLPATRRQALRTLWQKVPVNLAEKGNRTLSTPQTGDAKQLENIRATSWRKLASFFLKADRNDLVLEDLFRGLRKAPSPPKQTIALWRHYAVLSPQRRSPDYLSEGEHQLAKNWSAIKLWRVEQDATVVVLTPRASRPVRPKSTTRPEELTFSGTVDGDNLGSTLRVRVDGFDGSGQVFRLSYQNKSIQKDSEILVPLKASSRPLQRTFEFKLKLTARQHDDGSGTQQHKLKLGFYIKDKKRAPFSISLQRPYRDNIDLYVVNTPERHVGGKTAEVLVSSRDKRIMTLTPFAHSERGVNFPMYLANRASFDKRVRVELYAVKLPHADFALRPGNVVRHGTTNVVPNELVNHMRDLIERREKPLAVAQSVSLQKGDPSAPRVVTLDPEQLTAIQWTGPEKKSEKTPPPTAGGKPTPKKPAKDPLFTQGLLCRIRELDENNKITGRDHLKWLNVVPMHPGRYVQATMTANGPILKIELSRQPRATGQVLNNPPVTVQWEPDEAAGYALNVKEEKLASASSMASLLARLRNQSRGKIHIAYVHVDGYPRAFAFRIDDRAGQNPAILDVSNIHHEMTLFAVSDGAKPLWERGKGKNELVLKSANLLRFDFRLFVPFDRMVYSRTNGKLANRVDVALQGNVDKTRSILPARPIETYLKVSERGTVQLYGRVLDTLSLPLEANGYADLKLTAKSSLVLDNKVQASSQIKIYFDGTPPEAKEVFAYSVETGKTKSGKYVIPEQTKTIRIGVRPNDGDGSGMDKVFFRFEQGILTRIPESKKNEPKDPDPNLSFNKTNRRWETKWKVEELPQQATVFAGLKDRAGNIGWARLPLVLEKQGANKPVVPNKRVDVAVICVNSLGNRLQLKDDGSVIFEAKGIPRFSVQKGQLTLKGVAPGEYKITKVEAKIGRLRLPFKLKSPVNLKVPPKGPITLKLSPF